MKRLGLDYYKQMQPELFRLEKVYSSGYVSNVFAVSVNLIYMSNPMISE